jgi:hypothetical protein
MKAKKLFLAVGLFLLTAFAQNLFAQGLNWEGQTGALITPFAYTAASPAGKFGKPEIAFHYLNTGSVIGNDYQISITEGIAKRIEVGYTASLSSAGSTPGLSPLFGNGFSTFHGKVTVIDENSWKSKWVPAIAAGAIGRVGIQRIATASVTGTGATANNADFYVVATKTITQIKGLPFLLNIGERVTNAQLYGQAGNAPAWQGRLFGAAAIVVKGPAKSTLIFGSEFAQQPHTAEGLPATSTFPMSLTYFARVVPHVEGTPLQIDFGVAQLAGKIDPAIDLKARSQFGMGVSYHF